ncbi:Dabb family protein [Microbacterium foliorum]|uniref:Stress responsive A/B Barrel Domain protein n=1 Tax=Microbacterium foliorum TaxID=104336 RepID=A0A0F0KE19_9MICO|nr:Dabb family protein [Microbacterium foliorum]AXL11338.1 Dabb family protein [Microbacterium foliorum]KJL19108.1 Stress responsive A/B Barrel Domain protein [Microbacterium foliorum]
MIRHIVSWKLAAEDADVRAEQASEVARRLNALDGVVPQLRSISAGANVAYPDTNWDVTLVADFDSVAALEEYQVHPAHEEVVAYVRSVVAARAAVDIEI